MRLNLFSSGLKNARCSKSVQSELMPTKDHFFSYLYPHPNDTSEDLLECLTNCQKNRSDCSVVLHDVDCKMYDISPSQSYGVSTDIEANEAEFIKLCPTGNNLTLRHYLIYCKWKGTMTRKSAFRKKFPL